MLQDSTTDYKAEVNRIETQILFLSNTLDNARKKLSFPSSLEKDYFKYLIEKSIKSEVPIIVVGMMSFLVFSTIDFFLYDSGKELLCVRALFTLVILGMTYVIPKTSLVKHGFYIISAGTFLCFWAGLWPMLSSVEPTRYVYHFWALAVFVFDFLVFRNVYRIMMGTSFLLFVSYILIAFVFADQIIVESSIDTFIKEVSVFYIAILLLLIGMGIFLARVTEASVRNDFIKNQLLALEAERLQILSQELEKLSLTDSMTGLANRRYAEIKLTDEWKRSIRRQSSLSLLMIDVDNFKGYNDYYGHQQGDECLYQVAQQLQTSCQRIDDLCARYGGEEFIVILSETESEQACYLAEEVRKSIESIGIHHEKSTYGVVTVSIGVSTGTPRSFSSIDELVNAADEALYEAKGAGRNQVICSHA